MKIVNYINKWNLNKNFYKINMFLSVSYLFAISMDTKLKDSIKDTIVCNGGSLEKSEKGKFSKRSLKTLLYTYKS